MDFDLGREEIVLQGKIKALAGGADTEGLTPPALKARVKAWLPELASLGYLALGLDSRGSGIPLLAAQEALATCAPGIFLAVETSTRLLGRLLARYGNEEARREFLPPLLEGRLLGGVVLPPRPRTPNDMPARPPEAEPLAHGVRLTGRWPLVINGPIADWLGLPARSPAGVAFYLVPDSAPGLIAEPAYAPLSRRGLMLCDIDLNGVEPPRGAAAGPFPDEDPLEELRAWEDDILIAGSLGIMQRCFDTAREQAKAPRGKRKPLIAHQEHGFKLAEMLTLLQTARLLAYRAAWTAASEPAEGGVLRHCAKVFCTESAEQVASGALQILGIEGYREGNPAQAGYWEAKVYQVAGTATEAARSQIGDAMLAKG